MDTQHRNYVNFLQLLTVKFNFSEEVKQAKLHIENIAVQIMRRIWSGGVGSRLVS